MNEEEVTHLEHGQMNEQHPETGARMVDITAKDVSNREAVASCSIHMSDHTRDLLLRRELPKGDALEVARIAGIMGAKRTADLIPLCHPISISAVELNFEPTAKGFDVSAVVRTADRTGVEMEALAATAIAALTVYDMVKGTERGVEITDLRLLSKAGGRSGTWERNQSPPSGA